MGSNKVLPKPSAWSKPFWEGTKNHQLLIQQCSDCHKFIMYPKKYCPNCLSEDLAWIKASGEGIIYSYTVMRANPPSPFVDELPYVVSVIELKEGVRILSNIINSDLDKLECGKEVKVMFKDINDEITLPKFQLV